MGRISMPQGKGSQMHNRRDYEKIGHDIPDNIDQTKTKDNVVLVDMDIHEAYKEIFGDAVERYNEKQKRDDRKISDYYEKIEHSKNGEKLFYEDVLQWGKKEDFEGNEQLKEKAKEALQKYAEGFQERNPNLRVIGAYIHMDEASPHLHLDYVPVAHGYKTGMDTRNSLDKALEQQGIEVKDRKRTVKDKETGEEKEVDLKEGRFNNRTMAWKDREREVFEGICRERGLEVEEKQKARGSLSVEEYKEAKERMIEPLREQAQALKEGGAYTNEQGEREYISYENSLNNLEHNQKHLSDNAFAYRDGGWFYDYDRSDGFTIPEGGIEQNIKDAETEAERITGEASKEAERIIDNANDKFDEMTERIEAYESDSKARIDSDMEKYAQERKEGLEGELDGLKEQIKTQTATIEKNNDIFKDQWKQYNDNLTTIKGQETDISEKSDRVQELDGLISAKEQELDQKARSISALDKVGSKIREQGAEIYTAQVPDGLFSKREVTVVEGYSPKELERVFQRASINQSAQKTVEQAQTNAQDTVKQAQEQANRILAQNQATIDRANELLRGEQERRRKLDNYEKTVKEKNAQLTQENATLRTENAKLQEENNNLDGINGYLKDEYNGLKSDISTMETDLKTIRAEYDRKTAFVDAQLSPQELTQMMNDSMITNLVQDTMHQTCLQLEQRGMLESGSMAFLKLDKKPILERFKEQIPDFVQKVKDHMQEIAERVITHHRHR